MGDCARFYQPFQSGGVTMSSELRTKFLDHMTIQRFSNSTKRLYVRGVEGLVKHYGQPPDTLTNEQIQAYFVYLLDERKVSWGTCNNYFSAIICFYRNVCNWDETRFKIPPRPGRQLQASGFARDCLQCWPSG
jgi:hypothetical protein